MARKFAQPKRIGLIAVLLAVIGVLATVPIARMATAANTATVGVGAPGGVAVFTPNVINISVGDSVTFNWVDGVHDARNAVTTDVYLPLSTGAASQTTTFTTAGTYYFYCSVHAKASDATDAVIAAGTKQVGKIVVTAPATATATTATTTATATATATATSTPTATPTSTGTPVVPPPLTVLMPADYFNPVALTVNLGDTVTFKNTDSDPHTVVSVPGYSPAPINLTMKPGETATFKFTVPGLYWYYCNAHATWDATNGQVKANSTVDDPSEPMEGFILVLAPASAPSSATVNIPTGTANNDSFQPVVTTVQAGAAVTWTNHDEDTHTVVSVPGSSPQKFNLGLPTGKSATFTFNTPGLYWYYCDAHADIDAKTGQVSAHSDTDQPSEPMMGVIAVLAAVPSTPTPTPTTAPTIQAATPIPTVAPKPPATGNGSAADGQYGSWLFAGAACLLISVTTLSVATRRARR